MTITSCGPTIRLGYWRKWCHTDSAESTERYLGHTDNTDIDGGIKEICRNWQEIEKKCLILQCGIVKIEEYVRSRFDNTKGCSS